MYGEGRPRLDLEYPGYGAHELANEGAFTSVVVLTKRYKIVIALEASSSLPHMIQSYFLHLSAYYTFFVPVSMSPGLPRKATNSRGEVTHLPATNPKCWQVAEVSQVD